MRAFIALELSEEIKEELSRLQKELKKTGADVKWVNPENIHLTIKFLGNVEEGKIEQIKKILDDASSQTKPFEIGLLELGAFPSLNYPRVIWVSIDKGCAEVERMAGFIEEKLQEMGFPEERRPFSAHLTLGRVRSDRNKARLKEMALSLKINLKSCATDNVTLFQSTLTPLGSIYTPLHLAGFKG